MTFPTNCPGCNVPIETHMKMVDIPFFKEVVLMATTCDACGLRENEVKGGAGIEEKGKKLSLRITDSTDLSRDVLKVNLLHSLKKWIIFSLTGKLSVCIFLVECVVDLSFYLFGWQSIYLLNCLADLLCIFLKDYLAACMYHFNWLTVYVSV